MLIHGHGTGSQFIRGFTVLELMVTLSIAGILLTAGIPSFQTFSRQQQMKAAIATLQNDLMMARSEAVHLGIRVVACPGTPGDGCSGSAVWNPGWIVFADANTDRQRQQTEPIIRHAMEIENMRILGSAGRADISFFTDGSAPGSNGSITFCGPGGPAQARKLIISNLGRIRREAIPDIDLAKCPR